MVILSGSSSGEVKLLEKFFDQFNIDSILLTILGYDPDRVVGKEYFTNIFAVHFSFSQYKIVWEFVFNFAKLHPTVKTMFFFNLSGDVNKFCVGI